MGIPSDGNWSHNPPSAKLSSGPVLSHCAHLQNNEKRKMMIYYQNSDKIKYSILIFSL